MLLAGVVLGSAAFFGARLAGLAGAVAVDDFNPDEAAMALARRNQSEVDAALANLTAEQRAAIDAAAAAGLNTFELESSLAELLAGANSGFENAAAFSPLLPDEMFDAYLGVGSDASGALADAILLVLAPKDGSAPIMVSLPRDLYVFNPCTRGWNRLNTGLGGCRGYASGTELLALMVQIYTGVKVDHVMRVTFDGFAGIVDALGGTQICTDNPARDVNSGLDLPGGCVQADGYTTLAWVRSRHTEQQIDGRWRPLAGSDFVRQRRQQDILFQLAAKIRGIGSLQSFDRTIRAVSTGVRVDTGWSFPELVRTAWTYRGVTKDSVRVMAVSVRNYRAPGGAAVLVPDIKFNDLLARVYPAAARD
jgi:LCP family protein required for cell wall assembly